MTRRLGMAAVCLLIMQACFHPAHAEHAMEYIHNAPESPLDRRYDYHWAILKAALEKTKDKYGPYRLSASVPMSEKRQYYELTQKSGTLTVMYLDAIPAYEKELIPIRIPVDRNLNGYRLLLIRKEDRSRFEGVKTLEDLRRFTYGFGQDWSDVEIMTSNRFKVVTGSNYDGLFEMLANKRFDIFLRGAAEVLEEFDQRKEKFPGLEIETTLLIYYPMPMYFWFPKNENGKKLAARAEEGMRQMIADGTYDRIFDQYQRAKVERLNLKSRTIFRIDSPLHGQETQPKDPRLWFDPTVK